MSKPTFEQWLAHVEVSGKRLTEWQLAWAREVLVNGRRPVVFRGRRTLPPIDSTIRLTPAFARRLRPAAPVGRPQAMVGADAIGMGRPNSGDGRCLADSSATMRSCDTKKK